MFTGKLYNYSLSLSVQYSLHIIVVLTLFPFFLFCSVIEQQTAPTVESNYNDVNMAFLNWFQNAKYNLE